MSLVPQDTSRSSSLDNTLGAWLLGTCISAILQGMVVFQTYRYFCLYPRDAKLLKAWVVAVLILETLSTALTMRSSYVYLVSNFFNPAILQGPIVRSMACLPLPAALAAMLSQFFFVRRVYLLGRRFRIIVVTATLCYFSFLGFYYALSIRRYVASDKVADLQEYYKYSWLASAGSSVLMVGDCLLTTVLIYFLRVSRTGIIHTDSLLDSLIAYAVGTGLLACVFNILNVVFVFAFPNNLIYTGIAIVLTKLYANSFLVALNMRDDLGNRVAFGAADTSPFGRTILHDARMMPRSRPKRGISQFGFRLGARRSAEPVAAIELTMTPGFSRDTANDSVKTEHRVADDQADGITV